MKTNTNQMRNAECGMRNNNPAAFNANPFRPSPAARRPGFTLIELLVVISIMAIIAAFIFPVTGMVKRLQYLNTATAQLNQIELALDNYKAQYGVYPPCNQNPDSDYLPASDRSQLSQLYYELSGVTNNGTYFVTLDAASQIKVADVPTAYGVGGFVNCSKGAGEDATRARNFLLGLKANQINELVTNHNVQTTMLVTSVGGPDVAYQPLKAPDINPFRYVYPGTNNPSGYDLWVQLVIRGKTNLICNWTKQVVINSPLP